MKIKYFLAAVFFLLVTSSLSTNAVYAQNATFDAGFYYGDNKVSYKFSDLDLVKTPSWKPEQGEPPISVQKAFEIARANLPRFVKNADDFKVYNIILSSFTEGKWFYDLPFECLANKCPKSSEQYFKIIVTMDGEIVEPKFVLLKAEEEPR